MAFHRYILIYFPLLILILPGTTIAQQNDQSPWVSVEETTALQRSVRYIIPGEYQTYRLDKAAMRNLLDRSPDIKSGEKGMTIVLPVNEQPEVFTIYQDPVTAPALLAKFPDLMTYSGRSRSNPNIQVRLDLTNLGFHAMIRMPHDGYIFIDPYSPDHPDTYIVYRGKDLLPNETFHCFTQHDAPDQQVPSPRNNQVGEELRTFRIAIAATGEYTEFFGGTVASALSAIITSLNRINMIYETEAATRFELIGNNNLIIYTDADTDPYSNFNLGEMLTENQANITSVIGSNNYDIGHVFGTSGGGVANVGVACKPSEKARGATGLGFPVGDVFDVAYVCHEIGHQLNAVHTFNSCSGAGGWPNGYEPGSGTTIMAYAGLCGPDNVQIQTDYFFHSSSFDRIVSWGNNCATTEPSGNNPPQVQINVAQDLFLPLSTPFVLTGEGFDPDGDELIFDWEQMDVGPMQPLGDAAGNSPLFRFFPPDSTPVRVFPRMQNLIDNVDDPAELLPFYERSMSFRLVARDMQLGGGGVAFAELNIEVTDNAGPFVVTSPQPSDTWETFELVTVTWDVANTDLDPVNCERVNILLSTDGGYTYGHILAENVPNIGSVDVEVPDVPGSSNRIKVEAADHIFFDITDQDFTIEETNVNPAFNLINSPNPLEVCAGDPAEIEIEVDPIAGFDEPVELSILNLPGDIDFDLGQDILLPGESTILSLELSNVPDGTYSFTIHGESQSGITFSSLIDVILTARPSAIIPIYPAPLEYEIPVNTNIEWAAVPGSINYEYQVSDKPDFSEILFDGIINETNKNLIGLNGSTLYFWRVRGLNACGNGDWSNVASFHTAPFDCTRYHAPDIPKDIDADMPGTFISSVNVPDNFVIEDVNIRNLRIIHDDIGELEVFLQGPDNTQTTLLEVICPGLNSIAIDLDDESDNITLPCPPITEDAYLPRERLNEHDGNQSAGTWRLIIVDNLPGNGGVINDWELELCADQTPNYSPYIINNESLQLLGGETKTISTTELRASSLGSLDGDMVFVVETGPGDGQLLLDGIPVYAGFGFTQEDINNDRLAYQHVSGNGDDQFTFAVFNKDGGYIKDQVFNIQLLFNSITATAEVLSEISCYQSNDGAIQAVASGGFPPLAYSLDGQNFQGSPSFDGLPAGDYSITIRDQQDFTFTTNSVTLNQPEELVLILEQLGNDIRAIGSGGTGTLEYSLNGGPWQSDNLFEDPGNTTHTVRVRDENNCTEQSQIVISDNPLNAIAFLYSAITCHDANDAIIEVIGNGGAPPYEYSLDGTTFQSSPVFDGLGPGNYILMVRDNAGSTRFTNSIEIINPPAIMISIDIQVDDVEVLASGGTGDLEYSLDGVTYQSSPLFSDLDNGMYTMYVRDENDCIKSLDFMINTTSVNDPQFDSSWTLFPNPVDDQISILCDNCRDLYKISIYNSIGNRVLVRLTDDLSIFNIDTSNLPTGWYICELSYRNNISRKVFIRK